jgi:PAS domain S-box-containing protein
MLSVLYVDDEECLLEIGKTFLEMDGSMNVETSTSALSKLEDWDTARYDVIVSDYEMPQVNGIEFLRTLRSRNDRTPFIIFTGRGREEVVINALNAGADFYIQKGGAPKALFAELAHKIKIAGERRQTESALEQSNSVLRATLESTADGIMVADLNGNITIFNKKFLQMWQISTDTANLLDEQAFVELARDQVKDYSAYLKRSGEIRADTRSTSYDILHFTDGRVFRRFSQAQTMNSLVVGRVWSFRDITGQNKSELELQAAYEQLSAAEEELKQQYEELGKNVGILKDLESKYHGIFNADISPHLIVSAETLEILDTNEAACSLYGYTREEFLRRPFASLYSEPRRNPEPQLNKNIVLQTQFHRKKDGKIFPVEISSTSFDNRDPSVLILSIRDISTIKQVEESLRLANIKLNLLLGITRHDVLNNLSVLMLYNEILRNKTSDGEILEILDKQFRACQTIKNQIDFTKEYDKIGIKAPQWQDVQEIASRAFSQMLKTISFRCATENLAIYADPMLEKVFYNLFDNSFRYGKDISDISITFDQAGPDIILSYRDNGIGIAQEDKENIFRKGFGKNTGLGLFLTREILSITRISIVECGEYGKGACFEIRVPEGNYRLAPVTDKARDYGRSQKILADEWIGGDIPE